MRLLEERIRKEGVVLPGAVLRVDSFINQQIDTELLECMAAEWAAHFRDRNVTKVMTIESSGIAIAYPLARTLGVPLIFAKKAKTLNVANDVYTANVRSYTQQKVRTALVEKRFLAEGDRVLLADDFLANGYAMQGLLSILQQAGAVPVGICVAIEKGFQDGGRMLRESGYDVVSLAIVESMDSATGEICFREQ
ncbi:MAG: xanthine phosphoribosyltransferase [Ndongobacter sp.]|nr:xanthine phosphoribosyltransferase [Ndongobacter sp.]